MAFTKHRSPGQVLLMLAMDPFPTLKTVGPRQTGDFKAKFVAYAYDVGADSFSGILNK